MNTSRKELAASFQKLFILLILVLLIKMANPLIHPLLNSRLDTTTYGIVSEFSAYFSMVPYAVIVFMNLLFAVRLNIALENLESGSRSIWIIATLFFGLLPIIIFNELMIAKEEKTNAG